jgi:hypothetical protein
VRISLLPGVRVEDVVLRRTPFSRPAFGPQPTFASSPGICSVTDEMVCHLSHAIVRLRSAEIFIALFISDQFTVGQAATFVLLALFGNLIGGSVFVGVLNYAHIRQTQAADDDTHRR